MSTVGFGFNRASETPMRDAIRSLAKSRGYFASFDPNLADEETREGIEMLAESFGLSTIVLIHSPPRPDIPLAPDIYLEMREQRDSTSFFTFLEGIQSLLEEEVEKFTIFFAEEWYCETSVRRIEGFLEELLSMLRNAGGWHLDVYNFTRKSWWEFDEFPLVFTVRIRRRASGS